MKRLRQHIISIAVSLVFSLFFSMNNISAQSIDELELRLNRAKNEFSSAESKYESLKKLLNERAELINKAKNETNKSEDKIINLMSSSVSVSNDIKTQERTLKLLEKKVIGLKKTLSKRYTSVIDSLKNAGAAAKVFSEKNRIDNLIVVYTEKKLLVSPVIAALSLEPEKLLNLYTTSPGDPIQQKIVKEYLDNALSEVNSYLKLIEEENEEITEITLLQKKTQQFLEETEFGGSARPVTVISQSLRGTSTTDVSFGGQESFAGISAEASSIILPQLESYSKIMDQLSFIGNTSGSDWQNTLSSAKENLSLTEYKQFLDELESRLKDYKLILKNKATGLNE